MLYRLEIQNFYSIRELQIIDLTVNQSVPDEPGRFASLGPGMSERAPKVIAMFGANASGKSNVLKALSFIAWFIRNSFNQAPANFLPYLRFLDNTAIDAPTRLALFFTGPTDPTKFDEPDEKSCKYVYELEIGGPRLQPQKVLSESLKYWSFETQRQTIIFERDENGVVKANKIFGLTKFKKSLDAILRSNVSVISTLNQLRHPLSEKLWQFATQLFSNIHMQKIEAGHGEIAQVYNQNKKLLESLNNELERIDLGIERLTVESNPAGVLIPSLVHSGLTEPIQWQNESVGTRQFLQIFPFIFRALETGGVAVVDELDVAIHPIVLPEILRWFYDSERNPHDAQIWFTGQNSTLLEDLVKEEIFFCEKDKLGRTEVFGLTDFEKVRRDDNFFRKYMGGVYGAIPTIG